MQTTSQRQEFSRSHHQGRFLTEDQRMSSSNKTVTASYPLAAQASGGLQRAVKAGLILIAALGFASNAAAVDVYLKTEASDVTLPGIPADITAPVWKFVCDDASVVPPATNAECVDSSAGARIDAIAGDPLNVILNNTLTTPVSLVIPGQMGSGDPVPFLDGKSRSRARSLTKETAAGASETYSWTSLKAGTYLYQSGTYQSLQIPMGLHGALVVAADTGLCSTAFAAYSDAESCYDTEAVVLFSEIDPVQNRRTAAAAANGTPLNATCAALSSGTLDSGYPCSIDYQPTYLLLNGETTGTPLPAVAQGDLVLFRFLNAGLRSHTPTMLGEDLALLAEDGNRYPGLVKKQSAVLLAAGKTLDALVVTPSADITFSLFDRMPSFSNEAQAHSASFTSLIVGAGSAPPTPGPGQDSLVRDVVEDTATTLSVPGGSSLQVVTTPSNGTVGPDSPATPEFLYTPNPDFSGVDGFSYYDSATDIIYQVTINVSFENDLPESADDSYTNSKGGTLEIPAPGVLGNDVDVDGDTLTASVNPAFPLPTGVVLEADGSFVYSGTDNSVVFTYVANDDACTVAECPSSQVTITLNPASNIAMSVVDPAGADITAYRWLVQEDTSFQVDPANPAPLLEIQSLNFHKSYMPVIAQGCVGSCEAAQGGSGIEFTLAEAALDPTKYYYVSVLPNDASSGSGHTIGGAQVAPGATAVTVTLNNQEIPTAQISVYTFDDRAPTNGVPDPGEAPLSGFQIIIEDAGGRYGVSGGTMSQDAFGNPLTNALVGTPGCLEGTAQVGVILTCPDGRALVKNLPPGKFGVIAVPPLGSESTWTQTSTIEGSKVIDAWVKAGEPPFFVEFGAPGPHAFIGFVDPASLVIPTGPGVNGSNTVTGNVSLIHDPRPPGELQTLDSGSYNGLSHTRAWVGLNSIAGDGPNIATVQADSDGGFTLGGIPDGIYQLVVWDSFLDQIIEYRTVDLPAENGTPVQVPVNAWFSRTEHNVFQDDDENGIWDDGEQPIQEQALLLRWRDGTVNQEFPTDTEGFVPFDQMFPFFSWQVLEVDYARFKATGLTVTVDGGGVVDASGIINPQVDSPRTETGQVLTQAYQGFAGQTSIFEWGKKPYEVGENGGISGIVFYGSTRGENDPRLTVGDPWEPGIPRVKLRLYREVARANGDTALALVEETATDSWDDSLPTGCVGELADSEFVIETLGVANIDRCYDGLRNWNQARPGVFDGGYAFNDIPPGQYVVEVVVPQGYELIKEEDLNVGFGDTFGPNAGTGFASVPVVLPNGMLVIVLPDAAMVEAANSGSQPGIAQPRCVGAYHEVAPELSLFPGEAAPFAGAARPLCDRKEVVLADQGQAAADFHLFTTTPVAGQFTGLITDDLAGEPNRASPGFGEKFSPAFVPVSLRDFNGQEVYRTYGDAFGRYNGVLPSTFTANSPIPSGYSPAMMTACLNDPGDGETPDPLVQSSYSTACYNAQFMPGTNTYLDTPVLPGAAFAGGYSPADCAAPTGTPLIARAWGLGTAVNGPWLNSATSNKRLRIRSARNTQVPNPSYEGPTATGFAGQPTITRDFGFGGVEGKVMVGDIELIVTAWNNGRINARFPAGTGEVTGQLTVSRGDNGNRSSNGVTFTVSNEPVSGVTQGESIQDAIDAAPNGSLILVGPGTYSELVIMDKPIRLQGSGSLTVISAIKRPLEKLDVWRTRMDAGFASGLVDALPGQDLTLTMEQGPAIMVVAKRTGPNRFNLWDTRIDGFSVTGAVGGGGIMVNGYANRLEISNNIVNGNSGLLSGGIRVGHPNLPLLGNVPFNYNNSVNIHDNVITRNGAVGEQATGGGISLATGSRNYRVTDNFVCGNFSQGDGAGIGHLGWSDGGDMLGNTVMFNQAYNPSFTSNGGGIFIGGELSQAPLVAGEPQVVPSLGSGSVDVIGNLIQGNTAGSGHGGGIRTQFVNGEDVAANPGTQGAWYQIRIFNNMVVNNHAGWSGAGISMIDTLRSRIVSNTIANNDTTATAGPLINVTTNTSAPQPAGISVFGNSPGLSGALGVPGGFSDPFLLNNIVWHNRAFSYDSAEINNLSPELNQTLTGDCDASATYWDLGVLGATGQLNPRRSVLSDTAGYAASNTSDDPGLRNEYCNGARTLLQPGPMLATTALGEGGNFIDVRYGPLSVASNGQRAPFDYHIDRTGSAFNATFGGPGTDFDGQTRPAASNANRVRDIGADEALGDANFTSAGLGTLSAGTLDFGALGGAINTSVVTITVTRDATTFGTLSAVDDPVINNPRFTISAAPGSDTCSDATLVAGGSCTVTLNFRAGGTATRNGSLVVPHDGNGGSSTLALTGS